MKISKLTTVIGRDLYGMLECEHCQFQVKLVGGYDDDHWHGKVLPAFYCGRCGKNRAGELKSEEVTARNVANGVYGL